MADVAFSCFVSTTGLVLPFILVDPPRTAGVTGPPISNAESALVVWIASTGKRRPLTLSNEASAVFTYVLSMGDTRAPHVEEGYLEVQLGAGTIVTTEHFFFQVVPHF